MTKLNTNESPFTGLETTTVGELRKALRGLPDDAHVEVEYKIIESDNSKSIVKEALIDYKYSKKESTLSLEIQAG